MENLPPTSRAMVLSAYCDFPISAADDYAAIAMRRGNVQEWGYWQAVRDCLVCYSSPSAMAHRYPNCY